MGAMLDLQVRAKLTSDGVSQVNDLFSQKSWNAIAEKSEEASKIAAFEGSDWLPFSEISEIEGISFENGIYSFRRSFPNRHYDLLDLLANWLKSVSERWEMVVTSEYLDEAFLIMGSKQAEMKAVEIPLSDYRSPISPHALRPGNRDWTPLNEFWPIEYAMQPLNEIINAINGKKSWIELSLEERNRVCEIANKWSKGAALS